jgi:DNA-binding protein HU-beta
MTKTELVKSVMDKTGVTLDVAERIIAALQASMIKAFKKTDNVKLVGFGTFSVYKRSARIGHNPSTGAEIKIPAKKVIKFKAGSNLLKEIQ